ncbi:hypothetical protein V5O48_012616 [Marasmius crinis-equi]|uniref:Uncharacterized protein n=1 Tax=Marasmius crinis-equi TaxID=585013 RepID=A0ABR3F296_9AGAR
MADLLGKQIIKLGLVDEFSTLAADKASNNNTLRQGLASILNNTTNSFAHYEYGTMTIQCLAHAIHLVVQDFLVKMQAVAERDIDANEIEVPRRMREQMVEDVTNTDQGMVEMTYEELIDMLDSGEGDGVDLAAVAQKIHQICKIALSSPQQSEEFWKTIQFVNTVSDDKQKLHILNLILDIAIDKICKRNELYKRYRITPEQWGVLKIIADFLELHDFVTRSCVFDTLHVISDADDRQRLRVLKHLVDLSPTDRALYQPSDEDLLYLYTRTIGLFEKPLRINDREYNVWDCGDRRSERRKWIHMFENAGVIVFVVSLTESDSNTRSQRYNMSVLTQNHMQKSLTVFDWLFNSEWFVETKIVGGLINNSKFDTLEKRLQRSPLERYFQVYTDRTNVESACEYLKQQFLGLNQQSEKPIAV